MLNAAVSAGRPVLASCGGGPLKSVVEKYQLGVFVESHNVEEIVCGASKFVPNSATVEISGEDSGGIIEYAVRQSAAQVRAGVEVHFLCKSSFNERAAK